jgi:hypothetical protein
MLLNECYVTKYLILAIIKDQIDTGKIIRQPTHLEEALLGLKRTRQVEHNRPSNEEGASCSADCVYGRFNHPKASCIAALSITSLIHYMCPADILPPNRSLQVQLLVQQETNSDKTFQTDSAGRSPFIILQRREKKRGKVRSLDVEVSSRA